VAVQGACTSQTVV